MNDNPMEAAEDVVSANECTGLVSALPYDGPEAERSLAGLCAVLPPKRRKKTSHKPHTKDH